MIKKSQLTKLRIGLAFGIAGLADLLQIGVTSLIAAPYLWTVGEMAEYALDMVTAGLTILLLGFHPALFPTFILKVLPVTAMLPTWTACVGYVVWSRKDEIAKPDSEQANPNVEPELKTNNLSRRHQTALSGVWILLSGAALIGWFLWAKHRSVEAAVMTVRANTNEPVTAPAKHDHLMVAVGPMENLSTPQRGFNQPIDFRNRFSSRRGNVAPNPEAVCGILEDQLLEMEDVEVVGKQQMREYRSQLNDIAKLSNAAKAEKLRAFFPADRIVLLALLELHDEHTEFKGYGIESKSTKTKCVVRVQVMRSADGAILYSRTVNGLANEHENSASNEDLGLAAIQNALFKLSSDSYFDRALQTPQP